MDDWAYRFTFERKQFDSSGGVKSWESSSGERTFQEGFPVSRVYEKNGKKRTDQELQKQEAEVRRSLEEMRALSPAGREQRRRKQAEGMSWLRELPDALEYRFLREEDYQGRPMWVLGCTPKPGYAPKSTRARLFEKMNGTFWIDQSDRELVKAEAEMFDAVSIGFGLLGKIEKGTRFALERKRNASGHWLMASQTVKFAARVALFKHISAEMTTRHWDYRHKSQVVSAAR